MSQQLCQSKDTIINNGGRINENVDGTVSVYQNENGILVNAPLNKYCCELLDSSYTWDLDKQQCRWGAGCDNTTPFKVVLNPFGNDGAIFSVDELNSETCTLDISFDYLFQVNCDDIIEKIRESTSNNVNGELISQLQIDYKNCTSQLERYQNELNSLILELETTPYVIICDNTNYDENNILVNPIKYTQTTLTNQKLPIGFQPPNAILLNGLNQLCLTEAGLEQWNIILGNVRYQAWITSNGVDINQYTCSDVEALDVLDNNTGTLFGTCGVSITARQELINRIDELRNIISTYDCNAILSEINELDGPCSTVTEILESLDVCMTLEVVNTNTNLLETVYEESIFNIGSGNLGLFLTNNQPNTGILASGDTTNSNCNIVANQLIVELSQQLPTSGNTEIIELIQNSFSSEWLNFQTTITDQNILDLIYNKKIKISFKIKDCCVDFAILVDRIKMNRDCSKVDNIALSFTKSPSFDMIRTPDNKKSWITNENFKHREFDLKYRETEYDINQYKLAINTKEVDLDINPANAIEQDLYCYVKDNPCIIDCINVSGESTTCPSYSSVSSTELVINGIFNDSLSGWTLYPSPNFEWVITNEAFYIGSDEGGYLQQTILTVGESYQIELDITFTASTSGLNPSVIVYLGTTMINISGDITTGMTSHSITGLTSGNTLFQIGVFDDGGNELGYWIDNVSVKLIETTIDSNCCGDIGIDLDSMMSTSMSAITTLDEFRYVISSELIDVKHWRTQSNYPTLRLLYDRYLNSTDYCDTLSSQFNYSDMIKFSELVGTYWVDLIEQVIPSTTIWGSTYVYGNTIFDQQKFNYKKYTLFGCELPSYSGDVVSPTSGWTNDVQMEWEIIPNDNVVTGTTNPIEPIITTENITILRSPKQTPNDIGDTCNGVGIIQINCGSEFIGKLVSLNENTNTGGGGGVVVITECSLSVDINNIIEGTSGFTATAYVSGDVTGPLSYYWSDGQTTQTATNLDYDTVYTVTVTDNGVDDCSATNQIIVNAPEINIGDCVNGGFVFYLDGLGGGLVCAINDITGGTYNHFSWNGVSPFIFTGNTSSAIGSGQTNTDEIITQFEPSTQLYAAGVANTFINSNISCGGEFDDWYLPSIDELEIMRVNLSSIGDLQANFNFINQGGAPPNYFSSTNIDDSWAWANSMTSNGGPFNVHMIKAQRVRAIRSF